MIWSDRSGFQSWFCHLPAQSIMLGKSTSVRNPPILDLWNEKNDHSSPHSCLSKAFHTLDYNCLVACLSLPGYYDILLPWREEEYLSPFRTVVLSHEGNLNLPGHCSQKQSQCCLQTTETIISEGEPRYLVKFPRGFSALEPRLRTMALKGLAQSLLCGHVT